MIRGKYEKIIDQFELYYPYLYEQSVDWWASGRTCITVKLEDGLLLEFNYIDNTIRRIQPDGYEKDIEVLRKEVGHRLQHLAAIRGISQGEIAEKCGITQAMLSRYIHGTSMPGLDKIYSLASVLGCRPIDIIGESYDED